MEAENSTSKPGAPVLRMWTPEDKAFEIGVLPRLVHARFGLHVAEVLEREPGVAQPFESVRGAVAKSLRQQTFVTALRLYLCRLAAEATVEGVELAAADTPLVQ